MAKRADVEFGDEVRIASAPENEARGYAGRSGVCNGFTTSSYSGVEVIGPAKNDHALSVDFDESGENAWFSPDLVQYVGHAEGTVIQIGDKTLRRNADGSLSGSNADFVGRLPTAIQR